MVLRQRQNNQPPCASIAARNTSSCAASAARIASASFSHRRVEPSTSVNRNVTTPEGGTARSADTHAAWHKLRAYPCSVDELAAPRNARCVGVRGGRGLPIRRAGPVGVPKRGAARPVGLPVRRCHPCRRRSLAPEGSLATWRTGCTCRRTPVGRRRTLQAATSAEQGAHSQPTLHTRSAIFALIA